MHQLTRGALYERVWERTLKALATEHGVTPMELSAACKAADIPTPGPGYWTRKEMGKSVERTPLPMNRLSEDAPVHLVAKPRREKLLKEAPTPKPPDEAPLAAPAVASPEPLSTPSPPPSLCPHPAAVRTVAKLASAKLDDKGLAFVSGKGLFKLHISPAQQERAAQLLTDLAQAVESRGWSIKDGEGGLTLFPDGEAIGLELLEQADRRKHELTEAEARAKLRFEEKRQAASRRGSYFSMWEAPKFPEWDYSPSGRLSLKLEGGEWVQGLRRSFGDGQRQRLETMIPAVIESLAMYAVGCREKRERAKRDRLQALEAERRRQEAQRVRVLEEKRREFLKQQLERFEAANQVERFLDAISTDVTETGDLRAFVGWGRAYVSNLRQQLSPEVLEAKLIKNGLMDPEAVVNSWSVVE